MAETVSFASNGDTAQGYLARPATGTGAGVLVLQEWWGLVPQIKRVCDRLADEGFLAGIALGEEFEGGDHGLLITVTERRTRDEIDAYVTALAKAVA